MYCVVSSRSPALTLFAIFWILFFGFCFLLLFILFLFFHFFFVFLCFCVSHFLFSFHFFVVLCDLSFFLFYFFFLPFAVFAHLLFLSPMPIIIALNQAQILSNQQIRLIRKMNIVQTSIQHRIIVDICKIIIHVVIVLEIGFGQIYVVFVNHLIFCSIWHGGVPFVICRIMMFGLLICN